jgi:hypothetical protein
MMDGLGDVSCADARPSKGYLRPTNAKVSGAHAVHFRRLLYTVQMQDYGTKGGIVWIRQSVDESMHRVSTHGVVVHSGSIDELAVEIPCEKGIRQFTEELFQQPGNAIDVVLEGLWISEIDL